MVCITELSCTLVPAPTTILLKSPLSTAPNQTLAPSSTTTSPMRTAVGAIKASSATSGLLSSNGSKCPNRYLPVNEGARRSRAARTPSLWSSVPTSKLCARLSAKRPLSRSVLAERCSSRLLSP